jgi:hypothetical protein
MNSFGLLVLVGWIPATFVLMLAVPRRTALLMSVIGGCLFLPCGVQQFPGMPDLTKPMVMCLAPFVAALLLDPSGVLRFRPSVSDLPILGIVLCPLASSLVNGLGSHDGLSLVFQSSIVWGMPYVLGRVYFSDERGMRELLRAVVIGGLLYVPLCLHEIRLSPQLHFMVYGFAQHDFSGSMRYGGFRPVVFMQSGLMLAFWMSAASVAAVATWMFNSFRLPFALRASWCALGLMVTTLLCKSFGAIILMLIAIGTMWKAKRIRARWIMLALVVGPQLFVFCRVAGLLDRQTISSAMDFMPSDRVESLDTRAKNEDLLVAKALEQPLFGWGGWGRSRIVNEEGDDVTIVDSIWVEILGRNGLFGLISLMGVLFVGPAAFLARVPPTAWRRSETAPAFCLALVVAMFAVDCTMNAMINPAFLLAIGGLVSYRPARRPAPPPVARAA